MDHLPKADLDKLFLAIRASGHLQDGIWVAALATLNPDFHASLPTGGHPSALLSLQLTALNRAERIMDGTIPFEVVLASLKLLAKPSVAELAGTLLSVLEGLNGMGNAPGAKLAYNADQPEAYVGESDETLPFDFMQRGITAGQSVARLLVPRYQDGQVAHDGQGRPRIYRGTGWLISPTLFITNFHVLCARESDEGDPSPADLDHQVNNTEIHLDYDRDGATPRDLTVVGLVAHGARGGARDYALLRVAAFTGPPVPLRLRLQPPAVPREGYAVNIIQHPQGWPKRVAMRSNLLKSASTDKLEYFGDTLGGSSGSPLCNDAWEVIGLHRASGPSTNVTVKGRTAVSYNIGIPIGAVIGDLRAETKYTQLLAEIEPSIIK